MDIRPATSRPMSDAEATAEAERIMRRAFQPQTPEDQFPTSYRDDTPLPTHGTTPPIPQPDSRIVPTWATGTAVAGIGVSATCIGLGCGIWLACQGFAAVTLNSVLFVTFPIAAVAGVIAAVASTLRSLHAAHTENHHHYAGPVTQHHKTHNTSNQHGMFARTRNDIA